MSVPERNVVYEKELHITWKRPEGSGKLVILNLSDGEFYSLEDPVSIEIWEGLMAGRTPAAVLEGLERAYPEEDKQVLEQGLDRFLGDLLANRLICPCQPAGAGA